MLIDPKWKVLGHDHIVWQLVRYWAALGGKKREQAEWLQVLADSNQLATNDGGLVIDRTSVELFLQYLDLRVVVFNDTFKLLRDETTALAYCRRKKLATGTTATQNKDHHQSSKALVAAVTGVAQKVCRKLKTTFDPSPQYRCVWCNSNGLHVTARNLDGAIPSLLNPVMVWEIKEYWGKTSGGSKMSDAVYECQLVGRELRDFESKTGIRVEHVVFVDGKEQWAARQSDLKRFIDLTFQGFIDRLFVGKAVESEREPYLQDLLSTTSTGVRPDVR